MDNTIINLRRAGEYFMHSIWIQCQMSDLIILKTHPEFIENFINDPTRIPEQMRSYRISYWEKQFYSVKEEFKQIFEGFLVEEDIEDLEYVYQMRNAIAHSHISLGRDYFLFRPARGEQQEKGIKETFKLKPKEDASDPMVVKLTFHDDARYFQDFNRIKRLDEICFERLSNIIGIPHSKIR